VLFSILPFNLQKSKKQKTKSPQLISVNVKRTEREEVGGEKQSSERKSKEGERGRKEVGGEERERGR